jgi:redox-sensitive bicupin YhaK (pirin superfamily)
MPSTPIISTFELGFPWTTFDPFLFCVHHNDAYPQGTASMAAPEASLAGRAIGSDFSGNDGWSMYHGDTVPGFPRHPHRGFETISVVRAGFMDHADSLGAMARFSTGDVQWMTAGSGVVHSEMFPLLNTEQPNPTGLFQIWINLPAANKMSAPHFSMLWKESIPVHSIRDDKGRTSTVTVVAGAYDKQRAPSPPPQSWAANEANDVAILSIAMQAGATLTLPSAKPGSNRTLYFFAGASMKVGDTELGRHCGVRVDAEQALLLVNGDAQAEVLMLQGRPIGEPVAHYGPFVMNSANEIQQAIVDYRKTEFGGWPWKRDDPVHKHDAGRFAQHADGTVERP